MITLAKKLHIFLIFLLFSCSYPHRDKEVENQIDNHAAQMSHEEKNEIKLDFNQLKPELNWDSLIIYNPYSAVDADYNFRISLLSYVEDLNQNDIDVTVGFLNNRKLTSYALIDRKWDLLQILPPNETYMIVGRNDAVFNIKKNPR